MRVVAIVMVIIFMFLNTTARYAFHQLLTSKIATMKGEAGNSFYIYNVIAANTSVYENK